MAFWNIISQRALAHVQAFIKTLGEDAQAVEAYVRSAMIYHGEIPFTYKTFKPTTVPASKKKEKGGYVVVGSIHYLCPLSKQDDLNIPPDLSGPIPEADGPQHRHHLLWEVRHQAVPPDRSLHRPQANRDACPCLYRSQYPHLHPPHPNSDSDVTPLRLNMHC